MIYLLVTRSVSTKTVILTLGLFQEEDPLEFLLQHLDRIPPNLNDFKQCTQDVQGMIGF
jgi:hypothetical protein